MGNIHKQKRIDILADIEVNIRARRLFLDYKMGFMQDPSKVAILYEIADEDTAKYLKINFQEEIMARFKKLKDGENLNIRS